LRTPQSELLEWRCRDLAVIQIPAFDLPWVKLGNSNEVKVGTGVVLVGNPRGLEGSLSSGIVSGIRTLVSAGRSR